MSLTGETPPARDSAVRAAGFVLAGGESSRMGTDKALVQLAGKPLIAYALETLRHAGLEPAIAGARSDLSAFGCVIPDMGRGPLSGICAALQSTRAQYSAFLSVDTPLLPPSLLRFLLDFSQQIDAGISLVSLSGFAQTFPVVIHRSLLPSLTTLLETGNGGTYAAFRPASAQAGKPFCILPVEHLVQTGQVEHPQALPPFSWFFNLNTPADLAEAQSLLSARDRVS